MYLAERDAVNTAAPGPGLSFDAPSGNRVKNMLPDRGSLVLGACLLLVLSGCGSSSYGSSSGTDESASGTGSTGGVTNNPPADPISGTPGPTGTNDFVVATPSVAGVVSAVVGAARTVSITFTSSDGNAITGFGVTGAAALPAGWSGPSSFTCASVSTSSGCVLNLTYAPTAVASGTLSVDYVFVDNATVPSTGGSLTIAYAATAANNVDAAATPTGEINAVVGTGNQSVSVNFTADDGNAGTNLALTT